ncbi:MAG: hypothetical protein NTY98_09405 [Verrucomicrobia bacterium]|nr:hypothetical protein [Verrucomicrobiota bacterium]
MIEPINPYSPPQIELVTANLDIRRPASSKWMIAMSMILAGVIGWADYQILKESGLSAALAVFADYPLYTVASSLLLAAPVFMLRRKPGWSGYLLGTLSSFVLAWYFIGRVINQFASWVSGGDSLEYLLIGVAFALPFVVLFVRFAFGRPNRQFHGIGLKRARPDSVRKAWTE